VGAVPETSTAAAAGASARGAPPKVLTTTRYLAWLYSPPDQQPAFAALCEIESEIAASLRTGIDHHVAHARLQWWRDESERVGRGQPVHPLTRELVRHFQIGSGESRDGGGVPTAGSAGGGVGGGVAGVGRAVPGAGTSVPGVGRATPGAGTSVPGVGRATPEIGTGTPGVGSAIPGTGTGVPGVGDGDVPEIGDVSVPDGAARKVDSSPREVDGSTPGAGGGTFGAPPDIAGFVDTAVWDLASATFETRKELTAYCERWAAAMFERWTALGAAIREIELLANLAPEAHAGRLRVPLDELERAGVDPKDLPKSPWPAPLTDLLRKRHVALRAALSQSVAGLTSEAQGSARGLMVWAALAWRMSVRAQRALPGMIAPNRYHAFADGWQAWRAARRAAAGTLRLD